MVYLSGEPGVLASGMARVPVYYDLFEKLGQVGDVILPGYNTEESADDVEDLRRALGAAKISLVGHSYGSELALSVIRRHGDSIERSVLASVEGPGDHDTLPSVLDLQLKKIARLVADDARAGKEFPDLVSFFQADVQKLQTHPATPTITKQVRKKPLRLIVGAVTLQFLVEQLLSNGRAVSGLPALLQSVCIVDYSLLQRNLENLYNDFDSGITLMGRIMDCAGGTPLNAKFVPLFSRRSTESICSRKYAKMRWESSP